MATARSLRTMGVNGGVQNAWDNVAAAQTDAVVVAALPGAKIRVTSVLVNAADAGVVTFTFNSKGAGAGTPITPTCKVPVNGGFSMSEGQGTFETNVGEALTITTAAASALGYIVVYEYGA